MIGKILKSTKGKPCSCPSGKICSHCKKKKFVSPQIYVEGPRRLPTSVSIIYNKHPKYNQNQTVQYSEKSKLWGIRKGLKQETEPKTTPLCRWYRRRKALKELIADHKREQKQLDAKRREEYENERIKEIIKWDRERAKSVSDNRNYKWNNQRSYSLPPVRKEKLYIKERSAGVKPQARSKSTAVKRRNARDSVSQRFVNYCYRLCCQFYCYLTCVIIIACIVLFIV